MTENDQLYLQEVDQEIDRQKDLDTTGGQGLRIDIGDHQRDQVDTANLRRDPGDLQRGREDLQRGREDLQRGREDLQRGREDLQRGREDLRLRIDKTDTTGPDLDHLEIGTDADPDLRKSQENDQIVDPETKTINTNLISHSKSKSHEVTSKLKLIKNRQLRKLDIDLRVTLTLRV